MTDSLDHRIANIDGILDRWTIEGLLAPLMRAIPEATTFDLQKDSRILGRRTGDLIALSPIDKQNKEIAFLSNFAGHDPFFDPIAIVLARRSCPQFRRFLSDNEVAREFERLHCQYAIERVLEIRRKREMAN